jgi:AAA15 family ATPase/GTPase
MLIRFGFENHRSFADRAEISFVSSAISGEGVDMIEVGAPLKPLLPALLIYGANASGKTNIIDALQFMHRAVVSSYRAGSPTSGVRRTPFSLSDGTRNSPSTFDIDFMMEGVRYHYGFECTDEVFSAEWLYAFPSGRRQVLFERTDGGRTFSFSRELKGPTRTVESITRPNSLFVSTGAQNNHETLANVFLYFSSMTFVRDVTSDVSLLIKNSEDFDKRIVEFISIADSGIVSHSLNETKMADESPESRDLMKELEELFRKHIKIEDPLGFSFDEDRKELRLGHRGADQSVFFLPFDSESRGTRRLISLLSPIFAALDKGGIVIIDELDASLHTYICMEIMRLFADKTYNRKHAQLLATTHDTNLLSQPTVRRDQVWITEKSPSGKSVIYPLTDFRTKGTDNIERGYLRGRFGGVPVKLHN